MKSLIPFIFIGIAIVALIVFLNFTPHKPPSPIKMLAVGRSIELSWTNPDYEFFAYTAIYRNTKLLATTTASTYEDTDVTPGVIYSYTFYAVDDMGVYSDPVQANFSLNKLR